MKITIELHIIERDGKKIIEDEAGNFIAAVHEEEIFMSSGRSCGIQSCMDEFSITNAQDIIISAIKAAA